MTYNKIIQAFLDYSNEVLPDEVTVTREEEIIGENSPRPPKPYITLKIISGPGPITIKDELRLNKSGLAYDLVGQRSYTLSIKAYGECFNDILNDLSTCLDDPDRCEDLRAAAKIAITNKGAVLDISGQLPTGFESRGSLDIFFNSSQNKETKVGIIEGTEIAGQLKTENDKVITTEIVI